MNSDETSVGIFLSVQIAWVGEKLRMYFPVDFRNFHVELSQDYFRCSTLG